MLTSFNKEELIVEVNSDLYKDLAKRIAIDLIMRDENLVEQEIKKQIDLQLQDGLKQMKADIINEITTKLSVDIRNQERIKREIKKDISTAIKVEIMNWASEWVTNWAKNKLESLVTKDIKAGLKRIFSNELLDEYKAEMTLYFIDDLKKSLKTITPEITTVVIDKSYEVAERQKLPAELILMKNIYHYKVDGAKMSAPSGIYFLYKDNKLQYIGQSTCVTERIAAHIGLKDFDDAYFIPVSIEDLDHVETYLITIHKPPLNKSLGVGIHRCKEKVPSIYVKAE